MHHRQNGFLQIDEVTSGRLLPLLTGWLGTGMLPTFPAFIIEHLLFVDSEQIIEVAQLWFAPAGFVIMLVINSLRSISCEKYNLG